MADICKHDYVRCCEDDFCGVCRAPILVCRFCGDAICANEDR